MYVPRVFSAVFGFPLGQNLCTENGPLQYGLGLCAWHKHTHACTLHTSAHKVCVCIYFMKQNENWIRMQKYSLLLLLDHRHIKENHWRFAFERIHSNSLNERMQICRYDRQLHFEMHHLFTALPNRISRSHSIYECDSAFEFSHWHNAQKRRFIHLYAKLCLLLMHKTRFGTHALHPTLIWFCSCFMPFFQCR